MDSSDIAEGNEKTRYSTIIKLQSNFNRWSVWGKYTMQRSPWQLLSIPRTCELKAFTKKTPLPEHKNINTFLTIRFVELERSMARYRRRVGC